MKKEDLKKLDAVFSPMDLEWRIQQFGVSNGKPWAKVLCYVTSRAIMNRLDTVCGKGDWSSEIKVVGQSYICRLGIYVDGQWVYKEDGAEETNIEAVKGGISGSVKRAGVQWGIGRYLYNLEEGWAVFTQDKDSQYRYFDKKSGQTYYWDPPALPDWALPRMRDEVSQEPKTETVTENFEAMINDLLNRYAQQLQGQPYEMAVECLKNNGDKKAMYNKITSYLGKKGIKVA